MSAIYISTTLEPNCEWSAIDLNTYDVDCDSDGYFTTSPVGWGKTEAEAIADLMAELESRRAAA